ncbi:MAG: DNA repair protein RadC [Clostridia bacterium]|nr:DNA repair protein RadC [Clostridia bacterium]
MSEHAGHRSRLRARYKREGLAGFAPHEVLELLLTYALPRIDTNLIAHALIEKFGSLSGVLEASPQELERVPGVGPQASTLLSMMVPLLRLYEQEKLLPKKRFKTYPDLRAYCRTLFLGAENEQFYLLCLDARLNLLSVRMIAAGTPNQVRVEPRLVAQELLRCGAVGAVISHNHPSGFSFPSQEDIDLTRQIGETLEKMDIRLYDHIVIAGNQDYSFFSHHLLDASAAPPDADAQEEALLLIAADRPLRMGGGKRKKQR